MRNIRVTMAGSNPFLTGCKTVQQGKASIAFLAASCWPFHVAAANHSKLVMPHRAALTTVSFHIVVGLTRAVKPFKEFSHLIMKSIGKLGFTNRWLKELWVARLKPGIAKKLNNTHAEF